MLQALQAPTVDAANTLWGQVQDLLAQDLPIVPIVNSSHLGLHVQGSRLRRRGNGIEYLNTVWLSQ